MQTHSVTLDSIAWPISRLGELLENLARRSRLLSHPVELPQPSFDAHSVSNETVGRWIDVAAGNIGLEAEPVDTLYGDVEKLIQVGAPAILQLPGQPDENQPWLIALIKGGKNRVLILTPNLKKRRMRIEVIRSVICSPYEAPIREDLDQLLLDAQVPIERINHARKAILREQLAAVRIEGGWLLRQPPGASIWRQFRSAGAVLPLLTVFGMYFIQQILAIASWVVIARGLFMGHYDMGWLMAWIILLFATIPVSVIVGDAQTELSTRMGVIFKQRLLHGTLNLEPEEIRHQGMGQFLGRIMESESVEMLALNGGFMALLSFIELFLAIVILANGAGGMVHALFLLIWVAITLVILFRYYRIAREWTVAHREMTNELVENMVGHRTRLAQEDPKRWHEVEDQSLDRYLKLSENMDRIGMQLNAVTVRGWLLVGIVGLIFPFIANKATPQQLAISLGGILYAMQALGKLVGGFQSLVGLVLAWGQVGPLFNAAARPRELQSLEYFSFQGLESFSREAQVSIPARDEDGEPLLVARDINFRYRDYGKPILQDCDLQINKGDRILLEGSSGSGKSTLAAILTGLRKPLSGSMLLKGIDRQILGTEEWHRRVIMAPQFQENHVFSETFAFNLLMGRRWPPTPEDLDDALEVCRLLGLEEVLKKMPSGFQQMLGESGWQLSHGERSRLFIARTLLQPADLIILDESFGALDPENLNRTLRAVLERAPTLIVIAHP
jgi:ATP-binding cassette subfamily B protein